MNSALITTPSFGSQIQDMRMEIMAQLEEPNNGFDGMESLNTESLIGYPTCKKLKKEAYKMGQKAAKEGIDSDLKGK